MSSPIVPRGRLRPSLALSHVRVISSSVRWSSSALAGTAAFVPPVGGNKFPLLVKAGHRVTLELSVRTRRGAGLAYGPLPQGELHLRDTHRVVTFIACPRGESSGSSADGQAVTFWSGGILARSPRCIPLLVWVDAATAPRHAVVRLGARRCA